jgi:hypothetical protein
MSHECRICTEVDCHHGDTSRFRAHHSWSDPFAVRNVQKNQIGAGGDIIIRLVGLIVNVMAAGFGLEFNAGIDLLPRSLGSMRNLDEKWAAEISDGHGDNVEFLLSKNRAISPAQKARSRLGFEPAVSLF